MGEAQPACERHAEGIVRGEGPGGLPQEVFKFLKQFNWWHLVSSDSGVQVNDINLMTDKLWPL